MRSRDGMVAASTFTNAPGQPSRVGVVDHHRARGAHPHGGSQRCDCVGFSRQGQRRGCRARLHPSSHGPHRHTPSTQQAASTMRGSASEATLGNCELDPGSGVIGTSSVGLVHAPTANPVPSVKVTETRLSTNILCATPSSGVCMFEARESQLRERPVTRVANLPISRRRRSAKRRASRRERIEAGAVVRDPSATEKLEAECARSPEDGSRPSFRSG